MRHKLTLILSTLALAAIPLLAGCQTASGTGSTRSSALEGRTPGNSVGGLTGTLLEGSHDTR